ncbi:MAG: indole-3-glycerol phosphate synthase TrpC [Pyrinomonadaceae bacterium]
MTLLQNIIDAKKRRLAVLSPEFREETQRRGSSARELKPANPFRRQLQAPGVNIIAEVKRASPSKGVIRADVDVADFARQYAAGGAAAISVLTEEDFFRGSLDDLASVRNAVGLPVLRKDFIIDEHQLYETAAAGADAVLLIVAGLELPQIERLLGIAREELGLDVIVEVHTAEELSVAADIGADIIGINNRNLSTFEVSLDVSRELIRRRPPNALLVAESGLSSSEQIGELRNLGFDAFLIGETLMRSSKPETELNALIAGVLAEGDNL